MRSFISLVLASAGVLLLSACSDSTGPGDSSPQIISAVLLVDGRAITDGITPAHGDVMHFEARVSPVSGSPDRRVVMDHVSPPMGKGHGVRHHAALRLYDDGTHGDHDPGDGIYCHEGEMLQMMEYMSQSMSMMRGRHTFEIYVEDANGNHSERFTLGMTIN